MTDFTVRSQRGADEAQPAQHVGMAEACIQRVVMAQAVEQRIVLAVVARVDGGMLAAELASALA